MSNEQQTPQDENKLIAERRAKLTALREEAASQGASAFRMHFAVIATQVTFRVPMQTVKKKRWLSRQM